MKLKLSLENGDLISEYDIGTENGEWNILCQDEANQLIAHLQEVYESIT